MILYQLQFFQGTTEPKKEEERQERDAYQANKAMIYPTLKFFNISTFKNESTEVSTPKISLSVAMVNGRFLTDRQLHCL
jgi:hypothetical protein